MMQLPKVVDKIVQKAVRAHVDCIDDAVNAAAAELKKLPDQEAVIDALVQFSLQQMVYRERGQMNAGMRSGAVPSPKVSAAAASVLEAYGSYYGYFIAGKTLGSVKGKELAPLAHAERAKAEGHSFNANLCEALAEMVDEEQAVRDAVSERKLKALWNKLQKPEEVAA